MKNIEHCRSCKKYTSHTYEDMVGRSNGFHIGVKARCNECGHINTILAERKEHVYLEFVQGLMANKTEIAT